MARRPRAPAASGEEFSFVSPLVKYLLFFFNMLFWVSLGVEGTWAAGSTRGVEGWPGVPHAREPHCRVFWADGTWGKFILGRDTPGTPRLQGALQGGGYARESVKTDGYCRGVGGGSVSG